MAYTIPNWTGNDGGMEVLIAEGVRQYPGFAMGLLAFLYIIITGAGFFAQEKTKGFGNLPMWLSISGVIVSTLSIVMLLYDNIVSVETTIFFMVVTIACATWFLISER